ncbi:MAG: amidohydrolase family protein [Chitinophagales bacterium]|jgi:cytosine/adenosine deaminase-related metal-dependent hydrolase|nr:amidohydrolase family protein [Bacteroidota bacterium]MBP8916238.1 amidohydrolase family protein [Chitinophagales bacterium]MBP9220254.1 amidohydrolase family protein [Chitinophagales bacterium]MBP9794877.1 amidohydrolase family protein [Chitinophagales bacterium]
MRRITADIIYPITSNPLTDHVLLLEDDGTIINIQPLSDFDETTVEKLAGALVPGFINTHCHIELSHLKQQFPQKTGLPEFLNLVTAQREHKEEVMLSAIVSAEKEMLDNGIVAVGDISNLSLSFAQKAKRNLYYHTFIELIAFDPFKAGIAMEAGEKLIADARGYGIHTSLAPHATYSVSSELIKKISKHCYETGKPTSIHMLESNDENEFYVRGTGLYRKLYRDLGRDIKHFTPTGKTALESLLPDFDPQVKTLLVHNTIATEWDAEWAEDIHPNLFWCFCPNANLFIEDRMPDIPMLMKHVQYITIGTDSLASNHGLSILEELISIQNKFPEIKTNDLLRWGTLYGAKFLGIDDRFGSFDKGKKPGVNLIKYLVNESLHNTVVEKIL